MRVYRHELKYFINYGDYESLKVRMSPYFSLDPNALDGEYVIRSLYFDDLWNSAYEEKEMGVYFRKKYRIRIYNYSDKVIKLERKLKQGQYIFKESASLSRDEVYRIIDGDYDFLLQHKKNLCREFYYECVSRYMRPRVIVDYDRTPYILDEGTVRVTFDKKLRAPLESFDIFNSELPTISAFPVDKLIMEVKFTEFLPRIVKDIIRPVPNELVAASKYVMCCDKTDYRNM